MTPAIKEQTHPNWYPLVGDDRPLTLLKRGCANSGGFGARRLLLLPTINTDPESGGDFHISLTDTVADFLLLWEFILYVFLMPPYFQNCESECDRIYMGWLIYHLRIWEQSSTSKHECDIAKFVLINNISKTAEAEATGHSGVSISHWFARQRQAGGASCIWRYRYLTIILA